MAEHFLSPLDKNFLSLESPATHQAIAVLCILDRCPNKHDVAARLNDLLKNFPKLCHRLSTSGRSRWVQDFDFRLENHFWFEKSVDSNSRKKLIDFAARVFSTPLDSTKPPWRLAIYGGPNPNSPAALVFAIHHAFADGLGGLELLYNICDTKDDSSGLSSSRLPQNFDQTNRRWLSTYMSLATLVKESLSGPIPSPLNGTNSATREITTVELDLSKLASIKRASRTSLNDLFLALTCQAVRRLHAELGAPTRDLRIVMPVNTRQASRRHSLGNSLTAVGIMLPISLDSPLEQLLSISKQVRRLTQSGSIGAYALLGRLNGRLPRFLRRIICRAQAKLTNFICTNVPGPTKARYVCGAKIEEMYGLPALLVGHGLGLSFTTYSGRAFLSILTNPNLVPDPQGLGAKLTQAVNELAASIPQQQECKNPG